jgi:hypothetical protein
VSRSTQRAPPRLITGAAGLGIHHDNGMTDRRRPGCDATMALCDENHHQWKPNGGELAETCQRCYAVRIPV